MCSIFISSENCKTFNAHIPMLNLTDKLDLQRCDKRVPLSDLSVYYTWKNIKSTETMNLKYQEQHVMKTLNCLMDLVMYETYKTISNTSLKRMKHWQTIQQSKYMQTNSRLNLGANLNS